MDQDFIDRNFGILEYGTSFRGIGGKFKQEPEDFIVAEVLKEDARRTISDSGKYPLYILAKKRLDTLEVKRIFEKLTGLKANILGLKDKNAIAYQFLSVRNKANLKPMVEGSNFYALHRTFTTRPLKRTDLMANSFVAAIKGAEIYKDAPELLKEALINGQIPNYYGPQRFGETLSNHIIGRCIIKKNFEEAARLIFGDKLPREDAISSLRTIPLHVRRLYISAYQSFLFNLCISQAIREDALKDNYGLYINFHKSRIEVDYTIRNEPKRNQDISSARLCPLPGYSFREREDPLFRIMKETMKQEGVTPSQFYIKEMQELSAEGGLRPFSMVGWLKGWWIQDGKDIRLRFILLSGCYATILMRELTKSTNRN